MISYQKDPLLKEDFLTDKKVNLYKLALISYDKITKANISKLARIELKDFGYLKKLIRKKFGTIDKGLLSSVRFAEKYLEIKFSSVYKTKYRLSKSFNKNELNIVYLRIFSIILTDSLEKSDKLFFRLIFDCLIISGKNKRFKIPLEYKNLVNKETAYLIGVICGDGNLYKKNHSLTICDGSNKYLLMSKNYIKFISGLFRKNFRTNGRTICKGTYCTYTIENFFLCNLFNCLFEIPYGRKCDLIKLPGILKNNENEKYFWRGIFDTDGYIRVKLKMISLKTNSKTLIENLVSFCKKNNIQTLHENCKKGYSLRIANNSFLIFAKLIGSSHPRKSRNLVYHLKKGPYYKVFKGFNNNFRDDEKIYEYLRPYKENAYISFSKYLTKTDKKDVKKIVSLIKDKFQVKVIEIKRRRYNNHYCVCSKSFSEFLKKNCIYDLPWKPLNSKEIIKIKGLWEL